MATSAPSGNETRSALSNQLIRMVNQTQKNLDHGVNI